MTKFCGLTPILSVNNVPASIAYYVDKLGFDKLWDWSETGDGEATFAAVGRDEICIFLCKQGQGHPGTWMSIFVENVDDLYEQYKQSGADIKSPPTNYPWGMREMHVTDLDEHILRFGHGIEDTPVPVRPAKG